MLSGCNLLAPQFVPYLSPTPPFRYTLHWCPAQAGATDPHGRPVSFTVLGEREGITSKHN